MASILVTRAEPAASRTADALAERGHTVVKCPIFEVRDTGKHIPKDGYDSLIFTSRNAIEILENRGWATANIDLPVFCVGDKTAKAAVSLGFRNILTGPGNAEALANLIANSNLPTNSQLLYPAARNHTYDFDAALKPRNLLVETVKIYEARKLAPTAQELEQAFEQAKSGAVLIYSPRSGAHLSDLIQYHGLEVQVSALACVAISKDASKPLVNLPWREMRIASMPDESAMIQLAADIA